jgi:hypothetical protein
MPCVGAADGEARISKIGVGAEAAGSAKLAVGGCQWESVQRPAAGWGWLPSS